MPAAVPATVPTTATPTTTPTESDTDSGTVIGRAIVVGIGWVIGIVTRISVARTRSIGGLRSRLRHAIAFRRHALCIADIVALLHGPGRVLRRPRAVAGAEYATTAGTNRRAHGRVAGCSPDRCASRCAKHSAERRAADETLIGSILWREAGLLLRILPADGIVRLKRLEAFALAGHRRN